MPATLCPTCCPTQKLVTIWWPSDDIPNIPNDIGQVDGLRHIPIYLPLALGRTSFYTEGIRGMQRFVQWCRIPVSFFFQRFPRSRDFHTWCPTTKRSFFFALLVAPTLVHTPEQSTIRLTSTSRSKEVQVFTWRLVPQSQTVPDFDSLGVLFLYFLRLGIQGRWGKGRIASWQSRVLSGRRAAPAHAFAVCEAPLIHLVWWLLWLFTCFHSNQRDSTDFMRILKDFLCLYLFEYIGSRTATYIAWSMMKAKRGSHWCLCSNKCPVSPHHTNS